MASSKDKKPSTTVHRSKKMSFSLFPMSMTCQSDTKVSGDPTDFNTHQMMQQVVSDGTSNDKFAIGALVLGGAAVGIAALSPRKRADDAVDMDRVEELIKSYGSGSFGERAKVTCSSRYTPAERKIASQEVENAKKKARKEHESVSNEAIEAALADLKSMANHLRKPPTES